MTKTARDEMNAANQAYGEHRKDAHEPKGDYSACTECWHLHGIYMRWVNILAPLPFVPAPDPTSEELAQDYDPRGR